MSNSKKIISLLLSVIMIISVWSIVPLTASAAEGEVSETGATSGTTGDCTWSIEGTVLTISGNGKMGGYSSTYKNGAYMTTAPWVSYSFDTVVIEPGVTSIGGNAFYGCKQLTNVTIGKSVRSIGAHAFRCCSSLASVTIPDSVTSIGNYAFSSCSNLTNVYFGKSVTSIGSYAFSNCSKLTSITIGKSVTSIGGYAFYNCRSLTRVTISDSVTSIGNYAFYECTRLVSVAIPNSVTSIGKSAFIGCSKLTSVHINDISAWCSIDFLDIYSNPLHCAANLYLNGKLVSDLVIPESVTSIGQYAFYNCTSLTSVTIPDSVTSIGASAFNGCTSLTSVTIPDSVTSIGNSAFYGCTSLKSVTIPDSVTSIGAHAFRNCSSLTSVTIPDSITSIGDYAFYYCTRLTSVHISDIDTWCKINFGHSSNPLDYAHKLYLNDSLITELVIPDSVTSIGTAFRNCSSLTSVTIPDSVTSIVWGAFSGCSGLTSVTIPDSVTSIGNSAFYGCTGLTNIDIPDSVTSIGNSAFYGCTSLTSVTIPDSVTSIGNSAFYGCTGLKSVDIPESVTSIAESTFEGCSGLKSITIPDSVTSIGRYAFKGCTGLTSVTIGNSVTDIGSYAFSGCIRLANVTIPDSVWIIDNWAFYYCKSLKSITIGNSFTSIGNKAIPTHTHICCSPSTDAEIYAKSNGNPFGHDYVLTPIDSENHQGVCSYCGDKTEPEEHTFIDGVCSCGYTEGSDPSLNGLVDGYYYENGELAKGKGLIEFEGDIYFVKNDGSVYKSGTLKVAAEKTNGILPAGSYSFNAEGKLVTDGIVNGYFYVNGEKAKGAGVVEYNGSFYFVRNDGSVYTNGRLKVVEEKTNNLLPAAFYSIDENGKILCDGVINGYFYIDGDKTKGAGIVEYENNLYFVKNDGTIYTGGRLKVPEEKTNGLVAAGSYNFDADGKLQDVRKISDGYYYLNGLIVTGAGLIEYNGDLYFVKNDGAIYTGGRLKVPEEKTNGLVAAAAYNFDADGKMQDVQRIIKGYYYLNGQKVKGAGLIEYKGDLYFVKRDASIYKSGTLLVKEESANGLVPEGRYTFDADGKMIR